MTAAWQNGPAHVTAEDFAALGRASPWRWDTLRFTLHWTGTGAAEPAEPVRAWLRRPSDLRVETLDGEQTLTLEPGTQSGHVETLSGLGVGRLRGSGRGDLKVDVVVTTPTDLTGEERELLERLAELRGEETVHGAPQPKGVFARLRENLKNL